MNPSIGNTEAIFSIRPLKFFLKPADLLVVGHVYLESRLELLCRTQNADGGWGYFPRKQSWLEPSCYAILALHETNEAAADRAWKLVRSWQDSDGSWRPANQVQTENWATALCVTVASVRGDYGPAFRKGLDWLLATTGADTNWLNRAVTLLGLAPVDVDPGLAGWPWKPGTSSWIEPTAHTLIALKKASFYFPSDPLKRRVRLGEEMIFSRRCADGGWNFGNRSVYKINLPSYPETTALALLGLQGRPYVELRSPLELARRLARETRGIARAWLAICLRNYGLDPGPPPERDNPTRTDLMLAALEALGAPRGNAHLLRPSGGAA